MAYGDLEHKCAAAGACHKSSSACQIDQKGRCRPNVVLQARYTPSIEGPSRGAASEIKDTSTQDA